MPSQSDSVDMAQAQVESPGRVVLIGRADARCSESRGETRKRKQTVDENTQARQRRRDDTGI